MITKEVVIYYEEKYYRNMKEFALSFIPDNWKREDEDWYMKIKAFIMRHYPKYGNHNIRIIEDNKMGNFLKGIGNTKKNYQLYKLNKQDVLLGCPFNCNSRETNEALRKEIKANKLEIKKLKVKKKLEEESEEKEDCRKLIRLKKEVAIFEEFYKLPERDFPLLSGITDIGMSILNSLKYKVYPPSDRLRGLIIMGLDKIKEEKKQKELAKDKDLGKQEKNNGSL